jgi:hypothetical protein
MGALASLATVLGAGATIYGNVRQGQAQQANNRAQAQVAATQDAARQELLLAQQREQALQRRQTLARTVASARARSAASGISPADGSAAALTGGLARDAAAAQDADDATFRARLAQGRSSLLNMDGTLTTLLQAGRSFGSLARNLLD